MKRKPEIIKKDLISERCLNRLLIPMSKKRGYRKLEFPLTLSHPSGYKKYEITMSNFWDSRNFMLLDYIGHTIMDGCFKSLKQCEEEHYSYIPKSPDNEYTDKFLVKIKDQNDTKFEVPELLKLPVVFAEKTIKSFYSFSKLTPQQIINLFKGIQECKFTFKYPVRVYNKHIQKYTEHLIDIENESIFNFEIENVKVGLKSFTRNYNVNFNTTLGKIFIYNLFTINFDWIPSKIEFYKLPETSQYIFRKYILTRNNLKTIKFRDETLIKGLGFTNPNYSENIRSINAALNVIKDNKLIKGWQFKKNIFYISK